MAILLCARVNEKNAVFETTDAQRELQQMNRLGTVTTQFNVKVILGPLQADKMH